MREEIRRQGKEVGEELKRGEREREELKEEIVELRRKVKELEWEQEKEKKGRGRRIRRERWKRG